MGKLFKQNKKNQKIRGKIKKYIRKLENNTLDNYKIYGKIIKMYRNN